MPTPKNDIAAINDKFREDPLPYGKLMLTRGASKKATTLLSGPLKR